MDVFKVFSRRSFWLVFFMMLLLFAVIDVTIYFLAQKAFLAVSELGKADAQLPELKQFLSQASLFEDFFNLYFIPVSAAVMLIFTVLLWLFLRGSMSGVFTKPTLPSPPSPRKKTTAEASAAQKKERLAMEQRLFLHLVSLLQREGRLLDFFSENLDLYEDSQIGAAVRSIHQNCKKVIDKNIAPLPVLEKDEGDEVSVEPGFDPGAIKLTGNVTGDPPFTGVLRHRGWKAKRLDIPTLSGSQDASIIAPAEVEIM